MQLIVEWYVAVLVFAVVQLQVVSAWERVPTRYGWCSRLQFGIRKGQVCSSNMGVLVGP